MEEASIRRYVKLAQSGDGEAFRWLKEHCESNLAAMIGGRMGRALSARIEPRDILQEVWAKAWTSIGRFRWRGKDSFVHWLHGIAQNVINDKVRYYLETQRRREQSLEDHPQDGAALKDRRLDRQVPTASRTAREEERFARLAAALERLRPEYREVLLLARIRGHSIREVAVQMARTPAAVSCLLLRAVRELRREFGSDSTGSLGLPDRSLDGPGNGVGAGPGRKSTPGPLGAVADPDQESK